MKYWPASAIMRDLQPRQRRELMSLCISENTMIACHELACRLPAWTSITIICSEDGTMRRVYLERPTVENWIALERGGFVETFDGFGFVMDALH